jgi:mercuric ion transport protein
MKTGGEDLLSPHTERIEYPESDAGTRLPESTTTTVTTTGGLLVAFLASLCCLGPLVLGALGVGVGATGVLAGTAGALKALLPYRPYFIGLTVVLFGVAFYVSYRQPTTTCAPGSRCASATGTRLNRTILWVVAAVALGVILAPYWLDL